MQGSPQCLLSFAQCQSKPSVTLLGCSAQSNGMICDMPEATMHGHPLCNGRFACHVSACTAVPACCACCVASVGALLTHAPCAEDIMQNLAWLCNGVL